MNLALSESERQILLRLLDSALGEVRSGVRRTHNREWHDGLKQEEAALRKLIERLRADAE